MIQLTDRSVEVLTWYYENGSNHTRRNQAHIILLLNRGYSTAIIGNIFELKESYIEVIAIAWGYFGTDMLGWTFSGLKQMIYDHENPKPIPPPPEPFRWKDFFRSVYHFMLMPVTFVFGIAVAIYVYFKKIDISKYTLANRKTGQKNISIVKGNGNVTFQININGDDNIKEVASSIDEVVQKLDRFAKEKDEVVSDYNLLSWFLATADNVIHSPRTYKYLLFFTAIFIWYSSTTKAAGVVVTSFMFLGSIVWLSPNNKVVAVEEHTEQFANVVTAGNNPIKKMNLIDLSTFPTSKDSPNMLGIGEKEKAMLKSDTVDHTKMSYYIEESRNKVFLQVVAYDDIKIAALQRRNLIEKGFPDSKILFIDNPIKPMYGVTVGDATQSDIGSLGTIQRLWNSSIKSPSVKAIIKLSS